MKVFLFATIAASNEVNYMQFVAKTGRNIKSREEMSARLAVFDENESFISLTNKRKDISFQVGQNLFSDMFESEITSMQGHFQEQKTPRPVRSSNMAPNGGEIAKGEIKLPPLVDWRLSNNVSPVKH